MRCRTRGSSATPPASCAANSAGARHAPGAELRSSIELDARLSTLIDRAVAGSRARRSTKPWPATTRRHASRRTGGATSTASCCSTSRWACPRAAPRNACAGCCVSTRPGMSGAWIPWRPACCRSASARRPRSPVKLLDARQGLRFPQPRARPARRRPVTPRARSSSVRPVPVLDADGAARGRRALHRRRTQVPPMYSALKHQGQRLYALARARRRGGARGPAGRDPRLQLLALGRRQRLDFEVHCGKGTYVRMLAEDIARARHRRPPRRAAARPGSGRSTAPPACCGRRGHRVAAAGPGGADAAGCAAGCGTAAILPVVTLEAEAARRRIRHGAGGDRAAAVPPERRMRIYAPDRPAVRRDGGAPGRPGPRRRTRRGAPRKRLFVLTALVFGRGSPGCDGGAGL